MTIQRYRHYDSCGFAEDGHGEHVLYWDHAAVEKGLYARIADLTHEVDQLRAKLASHAAKNQPLPQAPGVFYTDPELLRRYPDAVVFVEFKDGSRKGLTGRNLTLTDLRTIKRWWFQ